MASIVEYCGAGLIGAGIAMCFTSSAGVGDMETARYLIASGIALIGGYAYGLVIRHGRKEE